LCSLSSVSSGQLLGHRRGPDGRPANRAGTPLGGSTAPAALRAAVRQRVVVVLAPSPGRRCGDGERAAAEHGAGWRGRRRYELQRHVPRRRRGVLGRRHLLVAALLVAVAPSFSVNRARCSIGLVGQH
jgi:hypothetical protein